MISTLKFKQPLTWKVKIKMTFHGRRANYLRSNLKTHLKKHGMAYSEMNTWTAAAIATNDAQQSLRHVLDLFEKPSEVVPSTRSRLSADVDNLSIEIKKQT
jgi:hypothetical protein